MSQLTELTAWKSLLRHADAQKDVLIRDAFAADPDRFAHLHCCAGGITADFSRQRIGPQTLELLLACLEEQDFEGQRARFFSGEAVNTTENRAALHMALRAAADDPYAVGGQPVMPAVVRQRQRAMAFADSVRAGKIKAASGEAIATIVAVGIGGSDLGPRLLADAFADAHAPQIHFISNVDGAPLRRIMDVADPRRTLVIVASKSFTTVETMRNAATLRSWLVAALGAQGAAQHMAAVTASPAAAKAFGVPDEQLFLFNDWVGGRYSIASPVALPAMIAMGSTAFQEFLDGMRLMDMHFRSAPLSQNLPVLMAALEIWNVNAQGFPARAVIPYAEALGLFPHYLQQLEMESLGKQVDRDGRAIAYPTAALVFGATGTNAQHAFMQALHQGNTIIPADILAVRSDRAALPEHHRMLLANALAQGQALAFGQTDENPHRTFSGNRPSTLLLLDALTPATLGQLIALYEHKVFVESVFWHINPFDQWGVELGKTLAGPIEQALADAQHAPPAALAGLMGHLRNN